MKSQSTQTEKDEIFVNISNPLSEYTYFCIGWTVTSYFGPLHRSSLVNFLQFNAMGFYNYYYGLKQYRR